MDHFSSLIAIRMLTTRFYIPWDVIDIIFNYIPPAIQDCSTCTRSINQCELCGNTTCNTCSNEKSLEIFYTIYELPGGYKSVYYKPICDCFLCKECLSTYYYRGSSDCSKCGDTTCRRLICITDKCSDNYVKLPIKSGIGYKYYHLTCKIPQKYFDPMYKLKYKGTLGELIKIQRDNGHIQ